MISGLQRIGSGSGGQNEPALVKRKRGRKLAKRVRDKEYITDYMRQKREGENRESCLLRKYS